MPRSSVAIFAVCLSLLAASPALAQYEVEVAKGYEEQAAPALPLQYSTAAIQKDFPDDQPEFLFSGGLPSCRLTFPQGEGADAYRYDVLLQLPGMANAGSSAITDTDVEYAVYGLSGSRIEVYRRDPAGQRTLLQTVGFPSLSAEYIWSLDLTGDGRNELVISGMTGVSNGGGAYVFRVQPDMQLVPVTEMIGDESWPQLLWSFYGALDLLRTPEGKWVFQGIAPIGRNLSEYFWSYFYEWDPALGRFTFDGPSYRQEKQEQQDFFRNFQRVLQDFRTNPKIFAATNPTAGYKYGFKYLNKSYSLDCFLEEDGTPIDMLLGEAIDELNYYLDPSQLEPDE